MQIPEQNKKIKLDDYSELINTVAKMESSRLSSPVMDYSELVNIGALTVHIILTSKSQNYHNDSYISTAIKWSIRNELRRRYKWYSLKHSSKKDDLESSTKDKEELREAVYETILSIDELEQAETPVQIEDNSLNPEQKIEIYELKNAISEAMLFLTDKERSILEAKFYQDKKIKEIALEKKVSSSRISKIIHTALDKIKSNLIKKGII